MKKAIKIFSLLLLMLFAVTFIGCTDDPMDLLLQDAKELVYGMYGEDTTTNNSFEVASQLYVDQERLDITWSVDVKSGTSSEINVVQGSGTDKTLIDIAFIPTSDIKYVLTAVITASNGASTTLTLPEFIAYRPEYMSWEEYAAARDDAVVMVKGLVTGVFLGSTSMNFYIQEEGTGLGFYVYGMTKTDKAVADIKVGVTVTAKGVKDTYNGTYEIVSAGYRVEDATVKTVTPKDITTEFAAASSSKDGDVAKYQGAYITIKGVEMTRIDGQYLRFELNNNTDSYVRVGSSSSMATSEAETALEGKTVAGNGATITGIGAVYSGLLYVMPLNADTITLTDGDLTDEQRVDSAVARVKKMNNTIVSDDITLMSWKEATISWNSSNTAVIDNDGKVNYPETEDATVTLTATITKGEVTKTETITVTVKVLTLSTIANAIKLDNDKKVKVEGTVVAATARGYILRDDTDMVYVYARGAADSTIHEVGKYIQIIGTTGYYNGEQITPISTKVLETGKDYPVADTDATSMDKAAIDAYVASNSKLDITYVKFEGTLSVVSGTSSSGSSYTNYNITVAGATNQGSISYPTAAQVEALGLKDGLIGTFYGYAFSHSSNRFCNFAITKVVEKEFTPAEQIAEAKKLADAVANDNCVADITLPTAFQSATIAWSSSNTAVIANDGKVVQGDADVEVTLSYTIKLTGQTDATGSVKVVVKKLEILTVADVLKKCDANDESVVMFEGIVVGFDRGKPYIADATGVVLVNSESDAPALGATVRVSGTAGTETSSTMYFRSILEPTYTAIEKTITPANPISNLDATTLKSLNTGDSHDTLDATAVAAASFNNQLVSLKGILTPKAYGRYTNYILTDGEGNELALIYYNSALGRSSVLPTYVGLEVTVSGPMHGYYVSGDIWSISVLDVKDMVVTATALEGTIAKTEEVGGSALTATVADQTITFAGTVAYDAEASANNVGVTLALPEGGVSSEVQYWVNGTKGDVTATADGLSLVLSVADKKDVTILVRWSNATAPATYTVKFAEDAVLEAAPVTRTTLASVDFTGCTRNQTGYLPTDWSGNVDAAYAGLGGLRNDGKTLITPTIAATSAIQVEMTVRGQGTANSYITVTAVDADGNVVATAKVLSDTGSSSTVGDTKCVPTSNTNTTIVAEFNETTFVSGKGYANVAKIVMTYTKVTGNLGIESVIVSVAAATE